MSGLGLDMRSREIIKDSPGCRHARNNLALVGDLIPFVNLTSSHPLPLGDWHQLKFHAHPNSMGHPIDHAKLTPIQLYYLKS